MFKTDFICILTAGHTVDGREIAQETLEQIAETYDPKIYNARINIDHSQYSSKLGSVLAVRVEGEKLFAQLKPNDYLLYLIQQGQYLHTSCEIVMNFAKTGKAYLTGLAVTDSPASLGTTEMHLSNKDTDTQLFSTNDGIAPQKPTLLNKILKQKDEDMPNKALLEMLSQMQESAATQTDALTKLTETVDKLAENLTSDTNGSEEPETEVKDQKEELTALAEKFEKQSEEMGELKTMLSRLTDEPNRQQATGGDAEHEDVY